MEKQQKMSVLMSFKHSRTDSRSSIGENGSETNEACVLLSDVLNLKLSQIQASCQFLMTLKFLKSWLDISLHFAVICSIWTRVTFDKKGLHAAQQFDIQRWPLLQVATCKPVRQVLEGSWTVDRRNGVEPDKLVFKSVYRTVCKLHVFQVNSFCCSFVLFFGFLFFEYKFSTRCTNFRYRCRVPE